MSGLNPDWAGDLLSIQFQFDNVFHFNLEPLGHLGTDEHGVVPGELGHRLGQFLQPAVVGELSVVDRGIAADVEFDGVGRGIPISYARKAYGSHGNRFRGISCSVYPAIVQGFAPELLEVSAGVLLLPVGADKVVTRGVSLTGKKSDKLHCALAVVKRSNQRLNNADRAIVSASI